MVDIFYYLLNNIHLTIRWLIELAIIAIAIILTVRGAKRKKQTFSAIALFLSCIMVWRHLTLYFYLSFWWFYNFALELIGIACIIINIIFLVKNRTVRTKDLNVVSCLQCGTLLPTGKKFCTKCGAELNPTNENKSI